MHKIISLTVPGKTLCSGSVFHSLQLCHYEVSEITRQSADCLEQNVQSFTSYCFSKVPPQNCHYVQLPSDPTAPQTQRHRTPTQPHTTHPKTKVYASVRGSMFREEKQELRYTGLSLLLSSASFVSSTVQCLQHPGR